VRSHLIDTSILCEVLLRRDSTTAFVRQLILSNTAATSIVVAGEALERVMGRNDYVLLRQQLVQLLNVVYPYSIDLAIMERYASIRRTLRPPYGPGLIGDIDSLIAATAIEHGLTLVTMDGDFARVPGLDLLLVPRR
jgi:predicted nucleic acid-binding protein